MAEPKTKPTNASVGDFINSIAEQGKREDSWKIARMMEQISGEKPVMWGAAIVGYGMKNTWPVLAFSPRRQNIVLYIYPGALGSGKLLEKLGKHKTGKACLYINKLTDVNWEVLVELVKNAYMGFK